MEFFTAIEAVNDEEVVDVWCALINNGTWCALFSVGHDGSLFADVLVKEHELQRDLTFAFQCWGPHRVSENLSNIECPPSLTLIFNSCCGEHYAFSSARLLSDDSSRYVALVSK